MKLYINQVHEIKPRAFVINIKNKDYFILWDLRGIRDFRKDSITNHTFFRAIKPIESFKSLWGIQ